MAYIAGMNGNDIEYIRYKRREEARKEAERKAYYQQPRTNNTTYKSGDKYTIHVHVHNHYHGDKKSATKVKAEQEVVLSADKIKRMADKIKDNLAKGLRLNTGLDEIE